MVPPRNLWSSVLLGTRDSCKRGYSLRAKSWRVGMRKAALAGAVALAILGPLSISSEGIVVTTAAAQDVVVSESHIARLKRSLHLTPAQQVHWQRVEAALRNYFTRTASADGSGDSYYQRARPHRRLRDQRTGDAAPAHG